MSDRTRKFRRFSWLPLVVLAALIRADGVPARAQGSSTSPPPPPVRQPAEFEPMQGVMIRYPLGIPLALVAEMAEDVEVVTVVADTDLESAARRLYHRAGVNIDNCSFLVHKTESIYTRDWGPWFVFDGAGLQRIVDFVYEWPNSPGDDAVPTVYGNAMGIPVHDMDVATAGGNYMTDGLGVGLATDFVWFNNKTKTPEQIDVLMGRYLGIETHHVLPDPGHYWLHIDCYAKLLDPDTVLITESSPTHPQYAQLEATVDFFESQVSSYGTPYEVLRVWGGDEFYTNSLILNDKVLVPLQGGPLDDAAMDAYRRAMPGYEVLGYTGKWQPWDGLHCRTKEIPDRFMLYVGHTPVLDRPPGPTGFPVEAEVIAHSGKPLIGGTPELRWKTTGGWNATPMLPSGPDRYVASIPSQPPGTEVLYYILAQDASGRSESHPYVGSAAPHAFEVTRLGADASAISASRGGSIELFLCGGERNAGRPYVLLASLSDSAPDTVLPGGRPLPLEPDGLTELVLGSPGSPALVGFQGTLDTTGTASARLVLERLPPALAGRTLHLAFVGAPPFDLVSNAVYLRILP